MPAKTPTRTPSAERDRRGQRLVDDLIVTARTLLGTGADTGDLKIVTAAVQEMRDAFTLFAPYRNVPKVSTFGSARTRPDDRVFGVAEELARRIADAGFMVITGAGDGIMEACQRGAGREHSFGVNINLPSEQSANRVIDGDTKLLSFRYFFTRKLFFIKEAHAVVLFPGGFGTHDEGFEVLTLLQTGKGQPLPLILLDAPRGTYWKTWHRYLQDHLLRRRMISEEDLALYKITDDIDVAVDAITSFYDVYHSSRYVRDQLALRLIRPLPAPFVTALAAEFDDIITSGTIVQRRAFSAERDEPEAQHLQRLAFRFNRTRFGRLRRLIDRINESPPHPPPLRPRDDC